MKRAKAVLVVAVLAALVLSPLAASASAVAPLGCVIGPDLAAHVWEVEAPIFSKDMHIVNTVQLTPTPHHAGRAPNVRPMLLIPTRLGPGWQHNTYTFCNFAGFNKLLRAPSFGATCLLLEKGSQDFVVNEVLGAWPTADSSYVAWSVFTSSYSYFPTFPLHRHFGPSAKVQALIVSPPGEVKALGNTEYFIYALKGPVFVWLDCSWPGTANNKAASGLTNVIVKALATIM